MAFTYHLENPKITADIADRVNSLKTLDTKKCFNIKILHLF